MDDITVYGESFNEFLKIRKVWKTIAQNTHNPPIFDEFPEEFLLTVSIAPWYAHIANFLITGELPVEWTTQDKKFFQARVHSYYW